jgi:hypothetical protein
MVLPQPAETVLSPVITPPAATTTQTSLAPTQVSKVEPLISPGPKFLVTNLNTSSTRVSPGEIIKIDATIMNIGDQTGDYNVQLRVNDEVVDAKSIDSLTPGSRDIIHFELIENTSAAYKLQVGSEITTVLVSEGLNLVGIILVIMAAIIGIVGLGLLIRWVIK